ncbi:Cacna1c, partial [Symbiodinium natans]
MANAMVEVKPIWAQPRQPHTDGIARLAVPASDAGTDVVSAEDVDEEDFQLSPLTDRAPPAPSIDIPGQAEGSEESGPSKGPPELQPPSNEPSVQLEAASARGSKETPGGGSKETPPTGQSAFFKRFRKKLKMDPSNATKAFMGTNSRQTRGIRSLTAVNLEREMPRAGWRAGMAQLVNSPLFEVVFAVAILFNTVIMAVQVQYRGLDVGFYVGHHSVKRPANEIWPGAEDAFYGFELFFGVLFSLEIFFKLLATDYRFFLDIWNLLDFAVVLAWFIDTLAAGVFPVDPLLLRLLRLLKLFRMLRLVRTIQGFDSLYVMITSIKGSIAALFWSVILLVLVLMMVSLFLVTMVENYIRSEDQELERRMAVYLYFGTFSRAMLSLFEMTLANWAPPSRALTENVSEFWMFFVLSFQLLVGFSVMKVIMGVFLQVTFYVASNDDVIMMSQKERALKVHTQKMTELFVAADENGNGRLDQEEFETILSDPTCIAWLSAMGFEASMLSGQDLYRLLCREETNDLSAEELCKGVAQLKGPATSLNLALLQKDQVQTKELMDQMVLSMVKLQARLKFSDMRKGSKGSADSSSSSSTDSDETEVTPPQSPTRTVTPGTLSQSRGKRLGGQLAAASSRKTRGTTRRMPGGAVSQVLFNQQKSFGSLDARWN